MRVSILLVLGATACSAEATPLHASRSGGSKADDTASSGTVTKSPTKADAPTSTNNGGIDSSPATTPPDTSTPAPSSTSSTPSPPSTPPAAGSCGAPKCVAGFGSCGCTATDSNGSKVQLGCQDGACACFAGFQQSTDVFDGDCADAKAAFFANCECD